MDENDANSRMSGGKSTEDVNRWLGLVGNVNDGTTTIVDLPDHQTNLSQNNVTTSTSKTPPAKSFTQLFENTVASRDADPTSLMLTSDVEQGTIVATVPSLVSQQNNIEINNLMTT
jgi:hypothetical protein